MKLTKRFRDQFQEYVDNHGIVHAAQVIRKVLPPWALELFIETLEDPDDVWAPVIQRAFEGYEGKEKRRRLDRRHKAKGRRVIDHKRVAP